MKVFEIITNGRTIIVNGANEDDPVTCIEKPLP